MCCSVLSPEIVMHDDAYIGGHSENNIKCVVRDDLWWKNQTSLYILPRDWLYEWFSQIDVELIRFFHGAIQLFPTLSFTFIIMSRVRAGVFYPARCQVCSTRRRRLWRPSTNCQRCSSVADDVNLCQQLTLSLLWHCLCCDTDPVISLIQICLHRWTVCME